MLQLKRFILVWLRTWKLWAQKPVVAIELTNRCNAHCTMCWRDEVKRKHTDMEWNDFERVVRRYGERGVRVFQLSFFGESTLYHELIEAVRFIKSNYSDAVVVLNTNGAYLTEGLSVQLIEAGMDQIRVSIDGNNAKEYEQIRKGLHYDQVRSNVERLWRLIKQMDAHTKLIVQGLNLKAFPLNVKTYQTTWASIAHQVHVRDEHDLIAERKEPFLHRLVPCPKLFSQTIVMVDGQRSLCAYDWHGEMVMGNALHEPARSFLDKMRLLGYRIAHIFGAKRWLPVCRNCSYQAFAY